MSGALLPLTKDLEDAVIAAEAYSFGVPPDQAAPWLARAGHEHVRCWVTGGQVAGALLIIPMGIWLGGRSVKNLGIAGVAVAPEFRGRGHGYEMMAATIREARIAGFAVTTLYPATVSLYRKCGYELAGGHHSIRLTLAHISIKEREGEMVSVGPQQQEALSAIQRPLAAAHDGNLDRGPYVWARVFAPRLQEARGFAASFDGALEGYIFLRAQPSTHPPFHDLQVTDLVAKTPRAMRRLLAFLSEHRSIAYTAEWTGDPHDPFLSLLPERAYEMRMLEHWMLRVVDVKAALEARGYRIDRGTALELEIDDTEVRENCGRVRLEIEDGRGSVVASRGGNVVRANIRGLSALYCGYQPASVLRTMGWISGDDPAIETAERIFAGRRPFMSEMF